MSSEAISVVFSTFVLLATVGWSIWRVRAGRGGLSEDELHRYGAQVVEDWRSVAPGPGESFTVYPSYWQSRNLIPRDAIQVARFLVANGQITLPNFGMMNLFLLQPPAAAALTLNAWEAFGPSRDSVTFSGDIYGPVAAGGTIHQEVRELTYHVGAIQQDLNNLAFKLYNAERSAPDAATARELHEAADVVFESAESGDVTNPHLRTTLGWLAGFASDAGAGVVSAGIVAAATGILQAIS